MSNQETSALPREILWQIVQGRALIYNKLVRLNKHTRDVLKYHRDEIARISKGTTDLRYCCIKDPIHGVPTVDGLIHCEEYTWQSRLDETHAHGYQAKFAANYGKISSQCGYRLKNKHLNICVGWQYGRHYPLLYASYTGRREMYQLEMYGQGTVVESISCIIETRLEFFLVNADVKTGQCKISQIKLSSRDKYEYRNPNNDNRGKLLRDNRTGYVGDNAEAAELRSVLTDIIEYSYLLEIYGITGVIFDDFARGGTTLIHDDVWNLVAMCVDNIHEIPWLVGAAADHITTTLDELTRAKK